MCEEIKLLYQSKHIIIYGAARNALDVFLMLEYLFSDKIIGFAVSNMNNNLEKILDVRVRSIEQYDKINTLEDTCVVVAMRDVLLEEVQDSLYKRGYTKVLLCGDDRGIRKNLEEECMKQETRCANIGELKNELLREHMSNKLEELRLNV